QNHDDKVVLFQTLRADLFERVAKDIDKYWFENFEKIGKAKDTAGKARKHSRYAVLVSFTLLVISAMVMRTMIMKKIVTPILDISHMSYRMAKGDLDLEIKLSSRDELQELSHNFNFMAASLKEKMKSLEASVEKEQRVVRELAILNEFTASVSSDLDLKSALQRFIEKTKDLMKAEIGAILFIQSDGMKSFLSTDSLIFEPTIARLLTYEAKDIGTVMREQIVSYKNDLALSLSDGRVIRNFMTLPLYSTTGIQCLLTVINTRTGFDQEQEDSLINFAFQAFQTLALQNEVVKLATTDGLTGLFNHRTFQNRLSEEILRGQRYQKSFVLILIDIDHFKHFNDTYGHQTGDDVLKTIAMIIRGSIRSVDFPARYGGEEFVVLLPESVCEHAFLVADRIRTSIIEHPFCFKDGEKASLSVSAGISCFPSDAIKKEDLIKMADSALYYAKNQGRNRVSLYRETLAH
ncbi:MAG: diguanylate cyclase, partial [Thermodesulfovibrionales bacterium]